MRPLTKFTKQIVNGNNIPHVVRECFRLAQSEKPGPTHLELPEDIAGEPVERSPFKITEVLSPAASQVALQQAADMINQAKHPLLLIASGANRHNTHTPLKNFIDRSGLFFLTTQMGKGAVDERHEKCLGTAALSDNDYIHCAIDRSDLIINVGHDVSEKPPFFMEQNKSQTVIHISYFPASMDDVYFPDLEIIGCMGTNLEMLAELLPTSSQWDLDYFFRVKKEIDQNVFSKTTEDSFPNIPQRIVSDVRSVVPSNGILSLDNGMYKIWFARNYRAYEPNTVLLDNALATMGAGLPGAIAAKLVHPDRPVIAICGDGGFMMNSQEIETAVRLGLDLVVIVLVDSAYGMIKWKQAGMGFADFGLDFKNPNFVKYAECYGARGTKIEKTGQLPGVLESAFENKGVHLIEVPIDYSENEKVFLEELKRKTCLL